jgi:hypothetical protein
MSTAQKYFMMEIIPNFTVAVSNSLEIWFTKITKTSSTNNNGPSNKFIFRATYGNSIVCNIFPA